jgi:hypothetical protein
MTTRPWVVLGHRALEFDSFEEACAFARRHCPSVVCERAVDAQGRPLLEERVRCDMLYDEQRGEWRIFLG